MARKIFRLFFSRDGYDPGIPTKKGYAMPRERVAQAGTGRVGPNTIGTEIEDVPKRSVRPLGEASPSERLWEAQG